MLGLGTIGQFAIGEVGAATAEVVSVASWFIQASEPVRVRKSLRSSHQQFYTEDPFRIPGTTWFNPLSEPVRIKKSLRTSLQRDFTIDTNWTPASSNLIQGWYNWLSEPVRFKKSLRTGLHKFEIHQVFYVNSVVLAAIETNDVLAFVVGSPTLLIGANVVIIEIPAEISNVVVKESSSSVSADVVVVEISSVAASVVLKEIE